MLLGTLQPLGFSVKFFIDNWFLIVAALISGGLLLWPKLRSGSQAGALSTAEAVQVINRQRGTLIDVSEPAEYAAGHATGSKNVPFGTLETATTLPKNKSLPLVLVCPTGARASRAVAILRKAGFENVHPLAGGLAAWREANLPIEKSAA